MIVDEYELSPIQQGMLFHHVKEEHSGIDIEQLVIEYKKPPDVAILERAWQAAIHKHPMLRSSFRWEGLATPVQHVHDAAGICIEQHECADAAAVSAFITADRRRGFDFARPPLMRLSWLRSEGGPSRLVWTLHHILMDGRAFVIVLDEVERYYRDLRRGMTPDITPGLPYKPYVGWIRSLDLTGVGEFWRDKLSGLCAPTPLPLEPDHLPKDVSSHGEVEHQLSTQVTSALRAMAKQHDFTLNTVVMGVWAIVLGRFSGESDVLFGATKTTRRTSISNGDSVVGLFLNTLPVRIDVSDTMQVVEMMKRLRNEWVSLRPYEHAPLVQVKQASAFPGAAQLFDSLVVFENQRFDTALASCGPEWRDREFRWLEQTNYGLTLLAYGDPAMTLKLEFDVRRFSRATAQRILAHVVQTFASVAQNPYDTIRALSIVPEGDRQRVLVDWNRTELDYPRDTPLATLVEAQVARTPGATAGVFGDASITYRELNERANQLARELVKHGAGPDALVGIFVERSLDMMVALLAVVKAGAGYLPMDPYLPAARLQHMIEDSALRVVVTQAALRSELPSFAGAVITLEDAAWRAHRCDDLNITVPPEAVAYVIYTSGSTGKPKGVQVPYRALVNLLWSIRDWMKLGASDRLLAVTTISFDIAGADIWMPWLVGATTVLASGEAAADGAELERLIARHDITFLQATPATWWLLLGAQWRGKPDLQIVCTGEAMPRELAARLVPIVRRLWNLYGPTETTIWSTGYLVEDAHAPILIGRPIGNTQCYVLDDHRQPAPLGSIGELYIAGDGVARGYLNRAGLTDERFVANPFGKHAGARMYRTGDLVRYLPDGNIECLGRTDHQVKILGFRIELGEIEGALKQHPGITQAVVVVREDTPGDKRLVAYVVPSSTPPPGAAELRGWLKQQLPKYMVPASYVVLDKLPISSNGKIDRKALPAPERDDGASGSSSTYITPRNDTEHKLAEIFSRVLGLEQVGIDDDFFDLGGHSLTAMRVISLLKSELDVDLPVRIMFKAHSVAQIAAVVAERALAGHGNLSEEWGTCIRIQPAGSNVPLFCVARPNVNALGYFFLSRHMGPEQPIYGLQCQLEEDPDIDFTPEQIRETAEEYVRAMRAVQARGPYYLVGQCQGAYIAFEMTRQLEAQGEHVAMLGMLDVWPDENTRHRAVFLAYEYARKLRNRLARGTGQDAVLAPVPARQPAKTTGTPVRSGTSLREKYWPGPGFKPAVVSAKIVVFRVASQAIYRIRDRMMGWRDRTVGPIEVEEIPGGHMTFSREPHVQVLAQKLIPHLHQSSPKSVDDDEHRSR